MITLDQIKVGKADKVDQAVVDEFIRNSVFFENMPFDDCVSPTGGSTLTYGYMRQKTTAPASGRSINTEYTPNESEKEKLTTDLKVMGRSYKIDRVLAEAGPDEIEFQTSDAVKATVNRWNYLLINGDKANENEYDGLAKLIAGTDTEFTSLVDLSSVTDTSALALTEELDFAIHNMSRKPDYILANSRMITKIKSVAKKLGYYTQSEDAFGRTVDNYDRTPLVDLGRYYNDDLGRDVDCIPLDIATGKTDIYLVCLGERDMHGVTINGDKAIATHLPDFTTAGAVKEGDVEFVGSIAVKNSRSVAVLKGVKVQGALSTLAEMSVAYTDGAIVTKNARIGNKLYYKTSATAITKPTVGTAITTSEWTLMPKDRKVTVTASHYIGVVEVDKNNKPIAYGSVQNS